MTGPITPTKDRRIYRSAVKMKALVHPSMRIATNRGLDVLDDMAGLDKLTMEGSHTSKLGCMHEYIWQNGAAPFPTGTGCV
jgi:hypothetical protein